MKKQVLLPALMLLALLPNQATAYDFEVDGIYYNITNESVAVTYCEYGSSYSGDVVIPDKVTYNGISYPVTAIGNDSEAMAISGAFENCTELKSVVIPNSVTKIAAVAFCGCSGLTSIVIPNSVDSISEGAFMGCIGLTSIYIPNTVSYIGFGAFSGCIGIISISVDYNNHIYDSRNDCNAIIETESNTIIAGCQNTVIPNSVTIIGCDAFSNLTNLTNIMLPSSVTAIDNYAFCNCTGLKNLNIPNSVVSIGNDAFRNCSGLKNLNIPNSVVSIGNDAFSNCTGLSSLTIGNSVSSIGVAAFENCSGLTNVTIGNSVTSISLGAFRGCTGLKNLNIPNSVISIEYYAFENCSGLTNVTIGNSVSYIEQSAFENCYSLSNLTIGNSVTSIGNCAFQGCTSLTSVIIPNSVTSIGAWTFNSCTGLTNLVLPNSVTSIASSAFRACTSLNTIYLTGEGEWNAGVLPCNSQITTLCIGSGITSVIGMKVNPLNIYCYATTPPTCDNNTFTAYRGSLHVPATSLASYFVSPIWENFYYIMGDAVAVQSVQLSNNTMNMFLGDEEELIATITPSGACPYEITWTTSNATIATVADGVVTAVGVGECDIIASCLDKRAICHVVVNDTISISILLDQQEAMLLPNHIITLTPSITTDVLPDLTVSSSDPAVAAARQMNGKVQVVGIKEGTTTITVEAADGTALPASCLVTVYTELGDVNCDGFVSIADVSDLIDYLLGSEVTNFKPVNADYDGDGDVSIADVSELIDFLLMQ